LGFFFKKQSKKQKKIRRFTMSKNLVFVYGSLMRGFVNHEPFLSQAVSLGEGTTEGILYAVSGSFPG